MAELAIVLAALSLLVSLAAAWYARSSSIATASMAEVEQRRSAREEKETTSARLLMRENSDWIQIWNLGQATAYDISVTYPGLLFQTLMEDDEAGLQIAPGDMLELMPLVDWDHPRNDHTGDGRRGGTMGVPRWPLDLAWRDGEGRHQVKRRVAPPAEGDGGD
ncbi:MAG: hypothetical protein IPL37_08640 [Austwickia sp.]|nr:hypothetical protein [Austwickia sp.]